MRATRYLAALDERAVAPTPEAIARLRTLASEALPERGDPAENVLATLDEIGSPTTVASAGGRFFGLVIGGPRRRGAQRRRDPRGGPPRLNDRASRAATSLTT